MTTCEIAVIGAGAAGIAAARHLIAAGRDVRLFEARDRIGGRLWTDHGAFVGIPFDRGAHWLHSASQNPLVAEADRLGWRYDRTQSFKPRHLFTGGGRQADAPMLDQAQRSVAAALAAIAGCGARLDVSFADCLDDTQPWHRLVWRTLSQMFGADPDQCSTADFVRYRDTGEDWPVQDGYGALVSRLGEHLPVSLSTPVRRIDRREVRLRIETDRGVVTADRAIVTLPTTVLAQGGLRFAPEPPAEVLQALFDCPMGVFEKVAILLDRPIDGLSNAYGDVIDGPPLGRWPVNLHIQPFGRPLIVAHLAGRVGDALVVEGRAAMHAAGREIMGHAFGSEILRNIRLIDSTAWRTDPWSRGSYACCRPGAAGARSVLSEPFDARIAFAGEHLWPDCFATAHGAWQSGTAVARTLIDRLPQGAGRADA